MRGVKGLSGVTSTASLLQPEVVIIPDPARAADLGVSTVDIAEAARIATTGDFRQNLPKLNLAERQIPIRVQVGDADRADAALLALMRVPGRRAPACRCRPSPRSATAAAPPSSSATTASATSRSPASSTAIRWGRCSPRSTSCRR
jgi:hypothetical protein